MTPRRAECLRLIREWWSAYGESPTRSELGRAMGITRVSAHLLVRGLERSGDVVVFPGVWRNIEPTGGDAAIRAL